VRKHEREPLKTPSLGGAMGEVLMNVQHPVLSAILARNLSNLYSGREKPHWQEREPLKPRLGNAMHPALSAIPSVDP
jgi:hypothetical protein